MDAIQEAIALIRAKRDEALAEVERQTHALAALEALAAPGMTASEPTPSGPRTRGPSVRTKALALMDEGPRDWSTGEIIAEYQRRGDPVHGKDPPNALRAALADLFKAKLIYRTAPGRYQSVKFPAETANNGSVPREEVVS